MDAADREMVALERNMAGDGSGGDEPSMPISATFEDGSSLGEDDDTMRTTLAHNVYHHYTQTTIYHLFPT